MAPHLPLATVWHAGSQRTAAVLPPAPGPPRTLNPWHPTPTPPPGPPRQIHERKMHQSGDIPHEWEIYLMHVARDPKEPTGLLGVELQEAHMCVQGLGVWGFGVLGLQNPEAHVCVQGLWVGGSGVFFWAWVGGGGGAAALWVLMELQGPHPPHTRCSGPRACVRMCAQAAWPTCCSRMQRPPPRWPRARGGGPGCCGACMHACCTRILPWCARMHARASLAGLLASGPPARQALGAWGLVGSRAIAGMACSHAAMHGGRTPGRPQPQPGGCPSPPAHALAPAVNPSPGRCRNGNLALCTGTTSCRRRTTPRRPT